MSSLALAACGGGSSDTGSAGDELSDVEQKGTLALALTDAEGDFLAYRVAVASIAMTRSDGALVEVLTDDTEVDFAQYVDVSELVSVGEVPAGRYSQVALVLDYSNAELVVQSESGEAITANAVDGNGEPLTSLTVTLDFGTDMGVVVSPGVVSQVTLDFDLSASNQVVIAADQAEVTVEPLLLVSSAEFEPKLVRARGVLEEVDQAASEFSLDLLPFRRRAGEYGTGLVSVTGQTSYLVNGTTYLGSDGLAALAAAAGSVPVVCEGEWDFEAGTFIGKRVVAGSSLAFGEADVVRGVVLARAGNHLTMSASVVELAEGEYFFSPRLELQLSDAVQVIVQRQQLAAENSNAISVGSVITAVGELNEEDLFAADSVHVWQSGLAGTVVAASPLVVDLQLLSGHRPGAFDFVGTGSSLATDADPDNYDVATGSLELSGLNLGEPVRVRGLVADFGTAPEDFLATTLVDAGGLRAHLSLGFTLMGAEGVFTDLTDDGALVTLAGVGLRHHIERGGIISDPVALFSALQLHPAGDGGTYAISLRNKIMLYDNFADFAGALQMQLAETPKVRRIEARGTFDDEQGVFSAYAMAVVLIN
ncbi:DUF4382 domain-containing protein [Halioxenophilus sp. WMMB6]|uniref:DUF4382 domain-containing protein n=1 Tax=Halioxenophilus sp. WMMB6 TaxID=3073815 RepID=UPI00295F56D3|nr:DUF4382 domain-containing protein [Halioxenophilus sp. WMMB6]